MNHTEQFNAIMERNKPAKKEKKTPPVLIGMREDMNPMQADLAKCSYSGNTVFLPHISAGKLLNYEQVRKALLNAGATYKSNTFIFPNDAKPYIDRLMDGESVNIKKEFQYYPTPPSIAEEMAAFAMDGFDYANMTILEPSAGQGALIKACFEYDDRSGLIVNAYELMDINRAVLAKLKDVVILGNDFLTEAGAVQFDRIIANPPFKNNQDIDHVYKMWECLKSGGRIVAITSKHWTFATGKKEKTFKDWLESIGATWEEIEAGAFKESGTNIPTVMLIIDKP